MDEYQDFKEFIKLFIEKKVDYLIVGGFAVSFHSREKFTADLDIWVKKTKRNAKRIFKVLNEFGYGNIELNELDFTKPGFVLQLGYPPNRIDVMTDLEGLKFEEAFNTSQEGIMFGELEVRYISFDDLLENKKRVGRPKDIFDINWMKKYNNKKSR